MAAGSMHTVFTSECLNVQFDWFATGVYESFRNSGMQGSITRLLACGEEELKQYKGLDLGPTFVHPNYRHNPLNGDVSASYNKPASVMHFTREANFTEEFILFIDADMVLVRPIDPIALGAKKGTVVSEYVAYMIGSSNQMAKNFLPPEAVPRAKSVGWYHIFHRDDLLRIAPLWLEYCGKVRTHPELYWSMNGSIPENIPTGDAYVKFGKAPWISEMYGYSFGAAMAGVEHVITNGVVRYPSETFAFGEEDSQGLLRPATRPAQPYILHYGIDFNIGDYNWNKMVYQQLDLFACRPRFFGAPPQPLKASERAGALVVNTLNAAFCSFYRTRCQGKPAARAACPPKVRPPKVPCTQPGGCCQDDDSHCWNWALDEQCEKNVAFMKQTCRESCGLCAPEHADHEVNIPDPLSPASPKNSTARSSATAALSHHQASPSAHAQHAAAASALPADIGAAAGHVAPALTHATQPSAHRAPGAQPQPHVGAHAELLHRLASRREGGAPPGGSELYMRHTVSRTTTLPEPLEPIADAHNGPRTLLYAAMGLWGVAALVFGGWVYALLQ
ncbi:hypothetical protein AB1Y20_000272 [Prymnesium parvum]|uniref:ShKT domain-containing protein n=1 Tax=Prymnesium parvum TaxID=97485 RepID=A0AB34K810_PRYPA